MFWNLSSSLKWKILSVMGTASLKNRGRYNYLYNQWIRSNYLSPSHPVDGFHGGSSYEARNVHHKGNIGNRLLIERQCVFQIDWDVDLRQITEQSRRHVQNTHLIKLQRMTKTNIFISNNITQFRIINYKRLTLTFNLNVYRTTHRLVNLYKFPLVHRTMSENHTRTHIKD